MNDPTSQMKQTIRIFAILITVLFLFPGCQKVQRDEPGDNRKSVLLDSDMVESFDDGVAFMIMLGSKEIDVWAQEAQYPIRVGRQDRFKEEVDANPGEDGSYLGASEYIARQILGYFFSREHNGTTLTTIGAR